MAEVRARVRRESERAAGAIERAGVAGDVVIELHRQHEQLSLSLRKTIDATRRIRVRARQLRLEARMTRARAAQQYSRALRAQMAGPEAAERADGRRAANGQVRTTSQSELV